MFDRLVAFAKELFDEQPQQGQQRGGNRPEEFRHPIPIQNQGERENRNLAESTWSNKSGKVSSNPVADAMNPDVLWSRQLLRYAISPEDFKQKYDQELRELLKKYGMPLQYKEPNMKIIKEYMLHMRDMYIIIQSQKQNQSNYMAELNKMSADYYDKYYPLMTKHQNPYTSMMLTVTDVFRLLPKSFKTREDSVLVELINNFGTFDKIIILKMTQNRAEDMGKFDNVNVKLEVLKREAEVYQQYVTKLRSSILKMKTGAQIANQKILVKFRTKNNINRVLDLLEKLKARYAKIIPLLSKDLADCSVQNLVKLYEVYLVAILNFKMDAQRFSSLKLLKRLDESVTKKVSQILTRLKKSLYSELGTILRNPRIQKTEILNLLIESHNHISARSKEILDKARVDGRLPKGLEGFYEANLLESHFTDIVEHNKEMDCERIRGMLFSHGVPNFGTGGISDSSRHSYSIPNEYTAFGQGTTSLPPQTGISTLESRKHGFVAGSGFGPSSSFTRGPAQGGSGGRPNY